MIVMEPLAGREQCDDPVVEGAECVGGFRVLVATEPLVRPVTECVDGWIEEKYERDRVMPAAIEPNTSPSLIAVASDLWPNQDSTPRMIQSRDVPHTNPIQPRRKMCLSHQPRRLRTSRAKIVSVLTRTALSHSRVESESAGGTGAGSTGPEDGAPRPKALRCSSLIYRGYTALRVDSGPCRSS